MDSLIKFNSQTAGRDKLFRLMQYTSRLIWGYLHNKKSKGLLVYNADDFKDFLKSLESTISTGRKFLRFGQGVDQFYASLNSLHLNDPTLRFTITLSKLNMALYLLTDHVVWLGRAELLTINKSKWSTLSYKFWLYAVVMNLCRDFYELREIWEKINFNTLNQELHHKKKQVPANTIAAKAELLYKVLYLHKDVVADTVKNACDVWLPLAQLGYVNMSPQTVGLLGVVSSALGILPLLDSSYKLSP